jgi:hypothetical protein
MLLKKTITGVYLFIINVCATSLLGNIQFKEKDGSYHLILPFYHEDGIANFELAMHSIVDDSIRSTFTPIYGDIDFDNNFIIFNLDKVSKNIYNEYNIRVVTLDGELLKSESFFWIKIMGYIVPVRGNNSHLSDLRVSFDEYQ